MELHMSMKHVKWRRRMGLGFHFEVDLCVLKMMKGCAPNESLVTLCGTYLNLCTNLTGAYSVK